MFVEFWPAVEYVQEFFALEMKVAFSSVDYLDVAVVEGVAWVLA